VVSHKVAKRVQTPDGVVPVVDLDNVLEVHALLRDAVRTIADDAHDAEVLSMVCLTFTSGRLQELIHAANGGIVVDGNNICGGRGAWRRCERGAPRRARVTRAQEGRREARCATIEVRREVHLQKKSGVGDRIQISVQDSLFFLKSFP
jgi:hypothetical protein